MTRSMLLGALLAALISYPTQAQIAGDDLGLLGSTELREGAALPHISLQRLGYGRTQLVDGVNPRPALLIMVDYTCSTLCGVTLDGLEQVLGETKLSIERDYRVLVVGFDTKDSDSDIANFRNAHISPGGFGEQFEFLRGSPEEIASITRAINFSTIYDRARDQFAHPSEIIVVTPEGRTSRLLDSLELTPGEIERSLTGASEDQNGGFFANLTRICYGWGSAAGIYTTQIRRVLIASGVVTLIVLFGVIVLLRRKENQARQGNGDG